MEEEAWQRGTVVRSWLLELLVKALNHDDDLSEMEAAVDGFGDAIYSEGVCRKVEIPAGADRQTTLLARLGRVA